MTIALWGANNKVRDIALRNNLIEMAQGSVEKGVSGSLYEKLVQLHESTMRVNVALLQRTYKFYAQSGREEDFKKEHPSLVPLVAALQGLSIDVRRQFNIADVVTAVKDLPMVTEAECQSTVAQPAKENLFSRFRP
jgi:hypothetical protein